MTKTHLKLVTPATKKRAVTPRRRPNSEFRSREHLTESEVEKLIEAAKAIATATGMRPCSSWLTGMGCGLQRSATCGGSKSSGTRQRFMSAE